MNNLIISYIAVFLPFVFGLYLLISRLSLHVINKKILNSGNIVINLISFVLFSYIGFYIFKNNAVLNKTIKLFTIHDTAFSFGINVNIQNILFLIFCSFMFLLFSVFAKQYFKKKKQFQFTKQRLYTLLSFLAFSVYIFLCSEDLVQSLIFWIISSIIIFVFSYFDIFKNPINYNNIRFHRLNVLSDFCYFSVVLILYKYAGLLQGYTSSDYLNFSQTDLIIEYMQGISSSFEMKMLLALFLFAVMIRLAIFPFSCYWSFFANASNVFYLICSNAVNFTFGAYIFIKFYKVIEMFRYIIIPMEIFLIAACIISIILMLFEKNLKIIFGYIFSIINSLFIASMLHFNSDTVLYVFFGINIFFGIILGILLYKDKINLRKRIINKQNGFLLEQMHIFIFETAAVKLAGILDLFDNYVLKNITDTFAGIVKFFLSLFVIKTIKKNKTSIIRNVLIIFVLVILTAIFIALFVFIWEG